MAQYSFPRVGVPMTDDQWSVIAQAFGSGILDMGGTPYSLDEKNSITDEVTIGLDSYHNFNSAILKGFVHFMDTPEKIYLAPVSTETVYEIGLTYDPLNSTQESGPIKLEAWVAPADYSADKDHIIMWRIIRKPNTALANSAHEEVRERISTVKTVSKVKDLPSTETGLTDTLCFVREANAFYRLSNNGTEPMSWVQITQSDAVTKAELDARLGYTSGPATPFELGDRVMSRFPDGTARVKPPKEHWDIVNLGTLQSGLAGKANNSHRHSGDDITSGTVPWERISGSTRAYSNTAHGPAWSSVAVDSDGRFWRYGSSTIRIKTNVRDAEYNENILDARLVRYDRTDHPEMTNELGFIAEEMVELVPELVYFDEDGLPNGIQYQEVGMHLVPIVAKQRDEIKELKAQLASEKARNDDFESRLAKLENNAD